MTNQEVSAPTTRSTTTEVGECGAQLLKHPARLSEWFHVPGRGANSRPFWELVRHNSDVCGGQYLMGANHRRRRFYSQAAAIKAAQKLNASSTNK